MAYHEGDGLYAYSRTRRVGRSKNDLEGKQTGRWIAPKMEKFLRKLKAVEEQMDADDEQERAGMYAEALTMLE